MFEKSTLDLIQHQARKHSLDPVATAAVVWVESAGTAYWTVNGKQVPAIRFEGHYFDQRLSGAEREKARVQGLAHPRFNVIKNPKSWAGRYEMLAQAMKINRSAALESISIGVGQVMGAHWKMLGFKSVDELWNYAHRGVAEQVDIMLRYIKVTNLSAALNGHKWAVFAAGYNGPSYKTFKYDTQMASAFATLSKTNGNLKAMADETTKMVQQALTDLGYKPGKVDGWYGPNTKKAIEEFQERNGLVIDGNTSTITVEELRRALSRKKQTKTADNLPKAGAALVGGAVGVSQITTALTTAETVTGGVKNILSMIGIEGAVAAVLLAAVAFYVIYRLVRRPDHELEEGPSW